MSTDAIVPEEARYEMELRDLQAAESRQSGRRERLSKIKKNAQTTALTAIVIIFLVAGVCDLLSIIDLGWVLSWLFSILMWMLIKNRIGLMHKSIEEAEKFSEELSRDLRVLAPQAVLPETTSKKLSSYTKIFIRDTIITQLIELIPVIDILPFYIGQLVKALVDQKKYRLEAQRAVSHCEEILGILEANQV